MHMKVVVSGADGRLGMALCRALASDHTVTGIGLQVDAGGDLGASRYRQVDLRLPEAVRESIVEAEVIVHAQTYVSEFYLRKGYHPEGEPFDEAGIQHIIMRKSLK